jgi:hypothetical protein
MPDAVIDRLRREFGQPSTETPKAFCWSPAPDFQILAERSGSPDCGILWIPWGSERLYLSFGEVYPPGKARSPDSSHPSCPSLAMNQIVLCLRIRRMMELDMAAYEIRTLAKA